MIKGEYFIVLYFTFIFFFFFLIPLGSTFPVKWRKAVGKNTIRFAATGLAKSSLLEVGGKAQARAAYREKPRCSFPPVHLKASCSSCFPESISEADLETSSVVVICHGGSASVFSAGASAIQAPRRGQMQNKWQNRDESKKKKKKKKEKKARHRPESLTRHRECESENAGENIRHN